MDNQDDLANEHVLMDPESGVLVRFQTKSDLLLASFMLGNRNLPNCPFVPLHIVNSLLQHVRDPNYDRAQVIRNNGKDIIAQILSHHSISPPSQENRNSVYSIAILILLRNEEFVSEGISLSDGVHILRSVADARRQATQECSFRKYNTLFSVAVLERTAEFLVEEDFREIRTEYWRPERVGRVRSGVSSTLRNMSLVHRSWTDPAQRAMRSSIIVFSAANIYALLRNPFSCKHLRAFVYNPGPYEFDPITEITQLLSALVESAPNLELLFLGTVFCWQRGFDLPGTVMTDSGYKPGPSTPGFVNIIPKLSAFRKLRVFYIEGQDLFPINQLWCALSEMHCLEDLAILGWPTPSVDLDALSSLSTLPPPAFLESVHVSFQDHPRRGQPNIHDALLSQKKAVLADFVRWLVQPRVGYAINSLCVHLRDIFYNQHQTIIESNIHAAILPALPKVTRLKLEGVGFFTFQNPFQVVSDHILRQCTSLHSLEISGLRFFYRRLKLNRFGTLLTGALPSQDDTLLSWHNMDEDIMGLVESGHPKLRLLELDIWDESARCPYSKAELLPRSSNYSSCHQVAQRIPELRLTLSLHNHGVYRGTERSWWTTTIHYILKVVWCPCYCVGLGMLCCLECWDPDGFL